MSSPNTDNSESLVVDPLEEYTGNTPNRGKRLSLKELHILFDQSRVQLRSSRLSPKGFTGKTAPCLSIGHDYHELFANAYSLYTAITPHNVNGHILAFKAHSDNHFEKIRLCNEIEWYKNVEDYLTIHAKLQFRIMMDMRKSARQTRETIEQTLKNQEIIDLQNRMQHEVSLYAEVSLLRRTNALPEVLVDMVGSYISRDLLFQASIPSFDEMEATLSKSTLPHIKQLLKLVVEKYNGCGTDKSIYRVFNDVYKDGLIATSDVDPTLNGWGHIRPKKKHEFVENVVAYVKAYLYFYKIFLKKATDVSSNCTIRRVRYVDYAKRFREEITYTIKFINLLAKLRAKQTKPKPNRTIANVVV